MRSIKQSSSIFLLFFLIIMFNSMVLVASGFPLHTTSLSGSIYELAWSPSNNTLAVATDSGVRLFDDELNLLAVLPGYVGSVIDIDWKDDNVLAGAGRDTASIFVWNIDTVQAAYTLDRELFDSSDPDSVHNVAWNPVEAVLAVSIYFRPKDNQIEAERVRVWNTHTWVEGDLLIGYHEDISNMTWNESGTTLLIGGYNRCIEGVNLDTCGEYGGPTAIIYDFLTLPEPSLLTLSVPVVPNVAWIGTTIALEAYDVILVDQSHSFIGSLPIQFDSQGPNLIDPSDSETRIGVATFNVVAIVDITTSEVLFQATIADGIVAIDWMSAETLLATASVNGDIAIWDTDNLSADPLPTITPFP